MVYTHYPLDYTDQTNPCFAEMGSSGSGRVWGYDPTRSTKISRLPRPTQPRNRQMSVGPRSDPGSDQTGSHHYFKPVVTRVLNLKKGEMRVNQMMIPLIVDEVVLQECPKLSTTPSNFRIERRGGILAYSSCRSVKSGICY